MAMSMNEIYYCDVRGYRIHSPQCISFIVIVVIVVNLIMGSSKPVQLVLKIPGKIIVGSTL